MVYKHHIIPFHEWKKRINLRAQRSNRDFNAPDNVVWLTLEQHIQVHQLLFELNGSKFDLLAWNMLSGHIGKEEGIVLAIKEANAGNQYALGYKHTPEWKSAESARMMGTHSIHTVEQDRLQSLRMMGNKQAKGSKHIRTQGFCFAISKRQQGKKRGVYHKELSC